MPKTPTFPTLFDEVLQINISKLKQWKYLNHAQIKSSTLTWSRNGNKIGSISLLINTLSKHPYVELDYKYNDEPRKYKVKLVSMPSNLGKGKIWYFLCPQTNKRCRKLYSIGGYFLHREAFNGCMYECQKQSKNWRQLGKAFGSYFESEKCYDEIYSKHFKKYYNGKPTKRYLRLLNQINKEEDFTNFEIFNSTKS